MTEEHLLEKYTKELCICPFCGNKPYLTVDSYGYGNYGSGHRLAVKCKNCDITMNCADVSWQDLQECEPKLQDAIKKWNKRG